MSAHTWTCEAGASLDGSILSLRDKLRLVEQVGRVSEFRHLVGFQAQRTPACSAAQCRV